MTKICNKCKKEKDTSEFNIRTKKWPIPRPNCKECDKEYRIKNKEKLKKQKHQRYIKNKEHYLNYCKKYREENLEWYRKYQREWVKIKRAENPHYNMAHRLRNRILSALKNGKGTKSATLLELLGCSFEFLKQYIEKQFTEGMTWQKYLDGSIEIDHIKPCCSFDLSKHEQQKICFHYTNLQPMWSEDNRKKLEEDKLFKLA